MTPPLFGKMVCHRTYPPWDESAPVFTGEDVHNCNPKPCDEAELESYIKVDRRRVVCTKIPEKWYESGKNHRVEGNCIARDFHRLRWTVRIDNSDALEKFIRKYETVIITLNPDDLFPCWEIHIHEFR